MKREMEISTGLGDNQRDFLLLYYYYLRNTLRDYTPASADPMLKFLPTSLGQKDGNVEKFIFSVGGFDEAGHPMAPSQDTYDLWTQSFVNTTPENNTRFYGIIPGPPSQPFNLPRGFMREQEKTYRRVIKSPAILDRLSDFPVFTTRDDFANDAPYPDQRPPLTDESAVFLAAVIAEPIYPTTIPFGNVWELSAEGFIDFVLRGMWIFYHPGRVVPVGQVGGDNFATIKDLLQFLEADATGDMRDDADRRTLRAKPLYRAVMRIMGDTDEVVALLRNDPIDTPSKQGYTYFRTSEEVPFVVQGYTRPWVDARQYFGSSGTDFEAQLDPEYILFRDDYESRINEPGIPETAIPNIYIYNLAATSRNSGWGGNNTLRIPANIFRETVNRDILDDDGRQLTEEIVPGDVMWTGHNSQSEYLKLLALGTHPYPIPPKFIYGTNWASQPAEINNNRSLTERETDSQPISIGSYFNQYVNNIQDRITSGEASKTIIIPATDFGMLEYIEQRRRRFPMNIGIEFYRQNSNNLIEVPEGEEVRNNQTANIIETNRSSTTFLAALGPEGTTPSARPCKIKSDVLRDTPHNNNRRSPRFSKSRWSFRGDLKFYDFADVSTYGSELTTFSPLIITEKCLEGSHGEFIRTGPAQDVITALQAVALENYKTYEQILALDYGQLNTPNSPSPTKSEVIGYKIEKREVVRTPDGNRSTQPGELIQTILLGNPSGNPVTSYIDTQIKYGKQYFYSLYEYRALYSTEYEFLTLEYQGPGLEGNNPAAYEALAGELDQVAGNPQPISYESYTIRHPKIEIVEVPLYDRDFYDSTLSNNDFLYGGLAYPMCSVRDYPPPPPELKVLPIMGNPNQIKLTFTPTLGDYTNNRALPNLIVPTREGLTNRANVRAHQLRYDVNGRRNFFGKKVSCKGEGQSEVSRMKVYRTSRMASHPTSVQDLYNSFNPESNPATVVGSMLNQLYAPNLDLEEGELGVLSYDTIDTIESNQYYYYTCVALDAHNNFSVPSPIYRVRLVFEKGLLIPEVELYDPPLLKSQTPSKDFTRFIQVKASGIQSFPYVEQDEDGQTTIIRSLGSAQRKSITNDKFVLRLTSKDTGKKFDLHLSFNNQDTRINEEDE